MKKIAFVCKYLPYYRLSVFNELSKYTDFQYEIIGDIKGREGIETIPLEYAEITPENGGINWSFSKSFYYKKSLQFWQTNVVSKIFSKDYPLFILDGAISHISTWIFAFLCRLANKKVLFLTHGFKGTDQGLKKMIRLFFFKKLPDGLLLYGDFSKEIMIKDGFNPNRLHVIGNSLNYKVQSGIKKQIQTSNFNLIDYKKSIFEENFKTLIFIGRLMPNKKVDEIINSIYKLSNQSIKLNCIIIGEGLSQQYLVDLVDKYEIQKQVYFANALYNEEDIAKLFLISDLMVSPGNVGLNCIHSLVYGVPVLTHDNLSYQNPEFEAINSGANGLFYHYNDYENMTEKIKLWFSQEHTNLLYECLNPIETWFNPQKHAENIHKAVMSLITNN